MISPEELEAMRKADAEIEAGFDGPTPAERRASDLLDGRALYEAAVVDGDRQRAYYAQRRDKVLERSRRWRENNPEKYHAAQAAWREKNRDKARALSLAHYYAHRDEINARRRAKRKEAKT